MYTVYTGQTFSRRKTLNHILDERDVVQWSGASIGRAIEWLTDAGHLQFRMVAEGLGDGWIFTIEPDAEPAVTIEPAAAE